MKQLFITLFILTPFLAAAQSSTAEEVDTTMWRTIRSRIADATMIIEIDTTNGEHYYNRGQLKAQMLDLRGAMDDFNTSLLRNSKEPVVYYARGAVKDRLGDLKGAKADFTKVIELAPDFAWGWNDRGQINNKLKNYGEAKADFEKARQLKPNWGIPVFNIGLLHSDMGEKDSAISWYKQCLLIDSTVHLAYNNIGVIYFEKKEYDMAITYFTLAIHYYPQYLSAYRNRADAKNAKGDIAGACADIKKAKELGDVKAAKYYVEYCK